MAEGANVPVTDPASYLSPDKECDLATTHHLRQIGGTSAGATAATAAPRSTGGRPAGS